MLCLVVVKYQKKKKVENSKGVRSLVFFVLGLFKAKASLVEEE